MVNKAPIAIVAAEAFPRTKSSIYPEPFASQMVGRVKYPLGDVFGLTNFGVNLTRLLPGSGSALRHAHSRQDEFIYILRGNAVLITNAGETHLTVGMCAGFKAGTGNASQLINRSDEDVVFLEIGDRSEGDVVTYPDDDLQASFASSVWEFLHKDGSPYEWIMNRKEL